MVVGALAAATLMACEKPKETGKVSGFKVSENGRYVSYGTGESVPSWNGFWGNAPFYMVIERKGGKTCFLRAANGISLPESAESYLGKSIEFTVLRGNDRTPNEGNYIWDDREPCTGGTKSTPTYLKKGS